MTAALRIRITVVLLLAGYAAGDAAAQSALREDFICSSGSTRRVVSVFNGKTFVGERRTGACHVDYTKSGGTQTVWSSKNDPAYCTAKAASLITRLVKGNFSCKTEGTDPAKAAHEAISAPAEK